MVEWGRASGFSGCSACLLPCASWSQGAARSSMSRDLSSGNKRPPHHLFARKLAIVSARSAASRSFRWPLAAAQCTAWPRRRVSGQFGEPGERHGPALNLRNTAAHARVLSSLNTEASRNQPHCSLARTRHLCQPTLG